jgi:hypothetical protein
LIVCVLNYFEGEEVAGDGEAIKDHRGSAEELGVAGEGGL